MRSYLFVRQVILISCFLLLSLAACGPEQETAVSVTTPPAEATNILTATITSTPAVPTATATATVSFPTATAVQPTATERATTLPSPTLPAATPTPTSTPTVETLLLTPEPIFTGGDVRLVDWSPDGRYLAYFEYTAEQLAQNGYPNAGDWVPRTFTIYDTTSGEKCQRYPLMSAPFEAHGVDLGQRHTWLPNGDFFIITATGQVFQANAPCGHDEELTNRFPEPIGNIVNSSPDGQWLLLRGGSRYWLYNLEAQASHAMAEVTPGEFNNLVWSPDSRHIGVTLPGDPIGGSRVVDVASGAIRARYDWEPANAIDGTYGGPVWLNNTEMLITVSPDQGPFFLTVDGEVRPLLPLFGLEFVRPDGGGEPYIPTAYLYVEPETGHYHILLRKGDFGGPLQPQLYHSDTNTVETLPISPDEWPLLTSDGWLIMYRDPQAWGRLVTAVSEPLAEVDINCIPPVTEPYGVHIMPHNVIALYGLPDCTLLAQLQLAGFDDGSTYLAFLLAPGGRWLAVVPYNNRGGFGQVLFVLDLENLE